VQALAYMSRNLAYTSNDRRHNLGITNVWQIPVGPDRRWLNDKSVLVSAGHASAAPLSERDRSELIRGVDARGPELTETAMKIWGFAEMGYLGLTLPAAAGGQGLGTIELAIVLDRQRHPRAWRLCVWGRSTALSIAPPIEPFESGRGVTLAVSFAGGDRIVDAWDGRAARKVFAYRSSARADSAIVDPDRTLLLDVHRTNNSAMAQPRASSAAARWAARWMVWLQHALLSYAALL
jgi:hypothetical protein